jgi:DNA helicase-2/ATP-dependent DNA helicase PcrA
MHIQYRSGLALTATPDRPDPFAMLNAEQHAAVAHGVGDPKPGPLLVIAGAGSGKTMTLAARVARLVLDGADPQRLLLLTFSRRAAQEMERRAGRMLHATLGLGTTLPAPRLPWCGTFHSVGARLLRDHAGAIGLAPSFTILDRGDSEDLMNLMRQERGFAAAAKRFPLKGTCMAIYSRAVNSQVSVEQVVAQHHPWCCGWESELRELFRAYVAEKQRQHLLDYDDLLLYWHAMMAAPVIAASLGERFHHVLVDEYQDTNLLQAAILKALKPDGHGLTVVGDDAQAIYSFRAAEVRNILDFAQGFDPPARVVALTRNYRSTPPILDASNAVIAQSAQRLPKELWSSRAGAERPQLVAVDDELAQTQWVADRVLLQREGGLELRRQAVLFRTGHHSAALELELTRRNIPFVKFGGLKFLEAAHVKDVLSVLRWVQNPRSRLAGFRVALLVPGIGPAKARRLLDAMDQTTEPVHAMEAFDVPASASAAWRAWLDTAQRLSASRWPDDLSTAIDWYRPHLERLHDDATMRAADLAQLSRLAPAYPDRERFLAELTLDPPAATSDESGAPGLDEDYLILSTVHSAKGQEWSAVYVLNVVDGCIPSDMATGTADEIEEERRLLYVAMTRAKEHLALLVPQRFYVTQQSARGDRHLYGARSRFVTPQVAALFDEVGPTPSKADARLPTQQQVDVQAAVRATW